MVARICSDPGVMSSSVLARRPLAAAWRAIEAARVMSSYDELVHEPMSADEISSGQSFSRAAAPTSAPTRWARSGECGPLISGLQLVEVDLDQLVVAGAPSSGRRCSATWSAASAMASRPVAFRYIAMLWS